MVQGSTVASRLSRWLNVTSGLTPRAPLEGRDGGRPLLVHNLAHVGIVDSDAGRLVRRTWARTVTTSRSSVGLDRAPRARRAENSVYVTQPRSRRNGDQPMKNSVRVLIGGLLGFLLALAFIITGNTIATLTHR